MRTFKSLSIALLLCCFMVAGSTTASAVKLKLIKPKTSRLRVKPLQPRKYIKLEKPPKEIIKRGTLRERLQEGRKQMRKNIANKGKGGNKNGVRSRTHQPSGKSFTKYSLPTVMNKDAQNAKKAADRLKTLNQRRQPIPPLHKSAQNFNNHRPSIDSVMH